MSSPLEVNLENPRMYSRDEIDRAAWDFRTGTLMSKPDDVSIYGQISAGDNVIMFPEVDIKSRWYPDSILKFGFSYSDELKILSTLHHENILHFMGYCDEPDVFLQEGVTDHKVILVYENEAYNGNLTDYLQNKDKLYDRSWEERLLICIGIANGLNYLHSGVEGVDRVIHNDIQSQNIMLAENLVPKIKGFYLSVLIPANQVHKKVKLHVHPENNPDPIYHETRLLNTTTDVYSYGIIMFEMLIGMVAKEEKVIGYSKPQRLINIVRHCYDNSPEQMIDPDLGGNIDRRSFQMFIDIAYRCISFNLKDRPTMDEVAKTIKEALDIHEQAPCPIAKSYLLPKEFDIPIYYIKKATSNFKEEYEIANNSSRLYKGYLNDGWDTRANIPVVPWQKGPVVVKRCNVSSYTNERDIASRLLQHENHIQLMGHCDEEHILVYECVDNGSLSTRLPNLTWAQRLKICIGAAEGLKYLHSGLGEYESVIHGRFSSENILTSKNLEAKICGLGSSFLVKRNHPDNNVYEKPVGGREMDPVYRETYIPKVESDVYSLGVVLFDILTGRLVDTECDGDEELILMALVRRHYDDGFNIIDPHIRDEIDVRSLHICKQIAYRCISYHTKDRPTLNKIIKRLKEAWRIQNAPSTVTKRSLQRQKLEDFLIPLGDINLAIGMKGPETRIGHGGFGMVYKGQPLERWQNRTVAIKQLNSGSLQGENEFLNELDMIFSFGHENIIPFVGYCDEGNEKYIVSEYASNGSLDCHLKYKEKRRLLTWEDRLKICLGAATGLDYLHSGLGEDKKVIHRDVKSANILLDHNLVAKVCDFGLSRSGTANQPDTTHTNAVGTKYYADPIYQESGFLRKESDVYSFGVVMFELLSGMLAHHQRSLGESKQKRLINLVRHYYNYRPDLLVDPIIEDEIDNRSFNAFREVAFQCISYNPKERPTMEAVADRLEEALELQVTNKGDLKQKLIKS